MSSVSETHQSIEWTMDDRLKDMICDVYKCRDSFIEADYENICINEEILLYPIVQLTSHDYQQY